MFQIPDVDIFLLILHFYSKSLLPAIGYFLSQNTCLVQGLVFSLSYTPIAYHLPIKEPVNVFNFDLWRSSSFLFPSKENLKISSFKLFRLLSFKGSHFPVLPIVVHTSFRGWRLGRLKMVVFLLQYGDALNSISRTSSYLRSAAYVHMYVY